MSTFDFLKLCSKIPRCRLLYVLDEIPDFKAFKFGKRDHVTVYNQIYFGHGRKIKLEDLTFSKK